MIQKLKAHINGILKDIKVHCAGKFDDGIYIMNSTRIIHVGSDDLDMSELKADVLSERTKNTLVKANIGDFDYIRHELPSITEIRQNVFERVGNYGRNIVVFCDEEINVNARYLYKAMDALSAKCCFVKSGSPGILIYKKDDPESETWEFILKYRSKSDVVGYVVLDEKD